MGPAERVPWGHWLEQLQNTKINTTVRAFQTKHVSDPACPIVRALRSAHFAICINTTRVIITVITALLLQGRNMAVMAFQITGPSTGSGNGLAPNRRQAITWTNETPTLFNWRRNHFWHRNCVVITVTPHERHDVSNHQSFDCLFNSMSWLITKQTSTLSHWRCNHL